MNCCVGTCDVSECFCAWLVHIHASTQSNPDPTPSLTPPFFALTLQPGHNSLILLVALIVLTVVVALELALALFARWSFVFSNVNPFWIVHLKTS